MILRNDYSVKTLLALLSLPPQTVEEIVKLQTD